MNILHVSDIDINSHAGGMNTVIPELIERQINYDSTINNTLFIVRKNEQKGGNRKRRFSVIYMEGDYIRFLRNVDLVIFHSVYNIKFILLFYYCKKYNIPYIIVSHGGLSKVALRKSVIKKMIFRLCFLNFFIKNARSLCFTSQEEQIHSAYSHKSYIIVPNPIELSSYSCRLYVNQVNKIQIVYLSKIDFYYKGLDVLFDALEAARDIIDKENISITFYGYGNQKDIDIDNILPDEKDVLKLVSRISKLNLGSKIQYLGPVFGMNKMEVLKNSDIYILTSRSEAMPLSITEALSVGTPCLITHGTNMTLEVKEYGAGWTTSLNREDLVSTLLVAIKEYRKSPQVFRMAARALYEKKNSVDVGKISLTKYKEILF